MSLKKQKFEDHYKFTNERVAKMKDQNRYFYMRKLSSPSDNKVIVDGKELIMFGSNNYLGIASHPKLQEAAIAAIKKYGAGAGGSRISSGTMELHEQLEATIASFKGTEDSVVFNCGYLTNLGVISTVADHESVIFSDKKNHASIIDGSLLSFAKIEYYPHSDMHKLEKKLSAYQGHNKKIIVTDGVFSMDGDIAKLPKLFELAQKYKASIVVDDAHSTGILGANGGGTAEHFSLQGKIEFEVGTLSKAIGGSGGFVAGSKEMISFLKHSSRQFIFSTSLPPPSIASALAALQIVKEEPERRKILLANSKFMRDELKKMGYNTGLSETQIIPVIISDEFKTYELVHHLSEEGIYALPSAYPVVRKKDSRIRLSVMATHTIEDIEKTLASFKKNGRKLGII